MLNMKSYCHHPHCLSDLAPGQSARVKALTSSGSIRRRLLDIGLTQGTQVDCLSKSPSGDPKAYGIRGAVIAIRQEDGKNVLLEPSERENPPRNEAVVALAGNPNVGKSTLFNQLTGSRQHTGNWPGKTVSNARGLCRMEGYSCTLVDLPGTYSLMAHSAEEEVARDFICFGKHDGVVAVCDATCLERNLNLVLQIIEASEPVLVCVNLMDEARRKGISIDLEHLSQCLGVPVAATSARNKKTLEQLKTQLTDLTCKCSGESPAASPIRPLYCPMIEKAIALAEDGVRQAVAGTGAERSLNCRWLTLRLLEEDDSLIRQLEEWFGVDIRTLPEAAQGLSDARDYLRAHGISQEGMKDRIASGLIAAAEAIAKACVSVKKQNYDERDRRLDRFFTSRITGYPVMAALLTLVFWITITGANYPSALLSHLFFRLQEQLTRLFLQAGAPVWLHDMLILGVYRVLAWVIAVMLPPMAIFFPLFTLLEDSGYLPRIAYNLDHPFQKCRACGKQALTMCMGFEYLQSSFFYYLCSS